MAGIRGNYTASPDSTARAKGALAEGAAEPEVDSLFNISRPAHTRSCTVNSRQGEYDHQCACRAGLAPPTTLMDPPTMTRSVKIIVYIS